MVNHYKYICMSNEHCLNRQRYKQVHATGGPHGHPGFHVDGDASSCVISSNTYRPVRGLGTSCRDTAPIGPKINNTNIIRSLTISLSNSTFTTLSSLKLIKITFVDLYIVSFN